MIFYRCMKNWFLMNLISPESLEIDILDEIGAYGVSAKVFAEALRGHAAVKSIRVNVNSPGGDVFDGLAIYNLLKNHAAEVTVHVLGMAASAASFIVCAGDRVLMPANAYLMTHDVRGGCYGTSEELKVMGGLIEKVTDSIASIYVAKSGRDKKECLKMMKGNHWMSAAEALEFGFCDEVLDEQRLVACAHFADKFSSLPEGLAGASAEGVEGEGDLDSAPLGNGDVVLPVDGVVPELVSDLQEPTEEPAVAPSAHVGVSAQDLQGLHARVAELTLERDEALARVVDVDALVSARVGEELAALGVDADGLPSAVEAAQGAQLTAEEFLAGLAKLSDPRARSEYHNKNFDLIKK